MGDNGIVRSIRAYGLACVAATAALSGHARAQQAGEFDWSALGIPDEGAIARNGSVSQTSAGVTGTVTWRVDTDDAANQDADPNNDTFVPRDGPDFIAYEASAVGTVAGVAELTMNAAASDLDDRVVFFMSFDQGVTDVAFTVLDVDASPTNPGFVDNVSVFVNWGSGFENARGAAFPQPVRGTATEEFAQASAFGSGWRGTSAVSNAGTAGNMAFDFGADELQGFAIVYTPGANAAFTNPSGQGIALSNVTYRSIAPPPGADVSLTHTVSDDEAAVGDDVTYTIRVQNDGPDAVNVTMRSLLPSGVTYISNSRGTQYDPNTGIWQTPGPIPSGGTRTITIVARVEATGSYTALAEILTSDQDDPDSSPGNADVDPFEDDSATAVITPGGAGGGGPGGTAAPLSCAGTAGLLDWDAAGNGWPAGDLNPAPYTVIGVPFDFSVQANGAVFIDSPDQAAPTPVRSQDNTGGLTPVEDSVHFRVQQGSRSSVVQIATDIGQPGEGVEQLQFQVFDVDFGANQFEDRIAVAGSLGGGGLILPTLTPSSGNRIENGQAIGTLTEDEFSGGGNLTVTFRQPVDRIVITYGNASRAPANPGTQGISLHDVAFCRVPRGELQAAKTVAIWDPDGEGLFMLPGNDALYTINVVNVGDGPSDNLFLTDTLPSGVTFWSGDVDGAAGPATGPVLLQDQGAGVSLAPGDIAFSNAGAAPADISQCTYTPNGAYDPDVRFVCMAPSGTVAAGDPDPSFSLSFRAQID